MFRPWPVIIGDGGGYRLSGYTTFCHLDDGGGLI